MFKQHNRSSSPLDSQDAEHEREHRHAHDGPCLTAHVLPPHARHQVLHNGADEEDGRDLDHEDQRAQGERRNRELGGTAERQKDGYEPAHHDDLLHGQGRLGHGERRAGVLGQGAFLQLLLR